MTPWPKRNCIASSLFPWHLIFLGREGGCWDRYKKLQKLKDVICFGRSTILIGCLLGEIYHCHYCATQCTELDFYFFDDSENFPKNIAIKVLFTDRRMQNFHPSLLRLVDRLYTVIHKTQKTRTTILPSAMVSELYFSWNHFISHLGRATCTVHWISSQEEFDCIRAKRVVKLSLTV